MDRSGVIKLLVDAVLARCPEYNRTTVTTAIESIFSGNPTLLGDNFISILFRDHADFTKITIFIGNIRAGNYIEITVQLPKPIDSLSAALATLASIPLDHVPEPRADLPHASRLPFEASPHFVGREDELKALAQAIGTAQPAVVMPAVATGLGGIGKTSLVTEFAYRYGVYFHGGVFWLNCADPDQVASQIAACAIGLNINTMGLSLDEQVQRVLHAWQSPMPRLLIFDNCEDGAILDRWKPTIGGCRVLVTSRSNQWPTLTQIHLGLLSPSESRALLQRLCARLTDAEAGAIAEDLGHLPLALHLAGSYLAAYPHHMVEQYRTDLTIAHRSLKGRGALPSPTRHELDVEATFMLSFNQLDPTNAIDRFALGMLDGAAWCAHGVPIPQNLMMMFVPNETDGGDAVDALRRLQQFGLIDGTDMVVLHRLLALLVQNCLGTQDVLVIVENQINRFAMAANNTRNPSVMLPFEPHLRLITMRAIERSDRSAASLANSLGFFDEMCGKYHTAQSLFEQALAIKASLLEKDHLEIGETLNNLAGVLDRQGRYKEAQELFERALAIWNLRLGETHPDTVGILNNLAYVLMHQGHYSNAKLLFEKALTVRESILGLLHLDTITSVNNLAIILERQEKFHEAQLLLERALSTRRSLLGEDHRDVALTLNNLAAVLIRQSQYGLAQPLLEKALIIWKAVLGIHHPTTAQSLNNLGIVLLEQGRYVDAQHLFMQALEINENILGSEHPDTALSLGNVAEGFLKQELYEDARTCLERALMIYRITLGSVHPYTLQVQQRLQDLSDK